MSFNVWCAIGDHTQQSHELMSAKLTAKVHYLKGHKACSGVPFLEFDPAALVYREGITDKIFGRIFRANRARFGKDGFSVKAFSTR